MVETRIETRPIDANYTPTNPTAEEIIRVRTEFQQGIQPRYRLLDEAVSVPLTDIITLAGQERQEYGQSPFSCNASTLTDFCHRHRDDFPEVIVIESQKPGRDNPHHDLRVLHYEVESVLDRLVGIVDVPRELRRLPKSAPGIIYLTGLIRHANEIRKGVGTPPLATMTRSVSRLYEEHRDTFGNIVRIHKTQRSSVHFVLPGDQASVLEILVAIDRPLWQGPYRMGQELEEYRDKVFYPLFSVYFDGLTPTQNEVSIVIQDWVESHFSRRSDPDEARELVETTLKKLSDYIEGRTSTATTIQAAQAYVHRVCRHVEMNYLEHRDAAERTAARASQKPQPTASISRLKFRPAVMPDALMRLSPKYRRALELYKNGLSARRSSEILSAEEGEFVSPHAVKDRWYAARKKLGISQPKLAEPEPRQSRNLKRKSPPLDTGVTQPVTEVISGPHANVAEMYLLVRALRKPVERAYPSMRQTLTQLETNLQSVLDMNGGLKKAMDEIRLDFINGGRPVPAELTAFMRKNALDYINWVLTDPLRFSQLVLSLPAHDPVRQTVEAVKKIRNGLNLLSQKKGPKETRWLSVIGLECSSAGLVKSEKDI